MPKFFSLCLHLDKILSASILALYKLLVVITNIYRPSVNFLVGSIVVKLADFLKLSITICSSFCKIPLIETMSISSRIFLFRRIILSIVVGVVIPF